LRDIERRKAESVAKFPIEGSQSEGEGREDLGEELLKRNKEEGFCLRKSIFASEHDPILSSKSKECLEAICTTRKKGDSLEHCS